jgi:hypothetical protein
MPVFSSKMTLFGKADLYTIIGMVSGLASPDATSQLNDREGNSCFSFKYYPEQQYLLKVAMYFRRLS